MVRCQRTSTNGSRTRVYGTRSSEDGFEFGRGGYDGRGSLRVDQSC